MCKLRIKELCRQRGMTQAELAKRIGRSPVSLSQAIHRGSISLTYLQDIADELKVSVPELFASTLTCPHCGKQITIKIEKI
jgi:transcriptional regulator with XRE-family HTH domain